MAIFRVEKSKDYTVMSNYHLRDSSLSLKAKGLLSQMLSLPEGWDYTLSGLATLNREGVDAIRTAVNELEKAGYITRQQTMDAGGKFASNEYVIREQPAPDNVSEDAPEEPLLDFPITENPSTGKPSTENPTQLNIDIQSKDISKKKNKKRKERTDPLPVFVEWIRSTFPTRPADDLNGLYADLKAYAEMRSESKSHLDTIRKISGLLNDLIDESGGDFELMRRMLRKATNNCWLSVHAPKGAAPPVAPQQSGGRRKEWL